MNKKQKLIIVSSLATLLIIVVILIIISNRGDDQGYWPDENQYVPEFMSAEEKKMFGLSEDANIQVLKREDSGMAEVYKVIREESDIIYDLDSVRPIDPRYD